MYVCWSMINQRIEIFFFISNLQKSVSKSFRACKIFVWIEEGSGRLLFKEINFTSKVCSANIKDLQLKHCRNFENTRYAQSPDWWTIARIFFAWNMRLCVQNSTVAKQKNWMNRIEKKGIQIICKLGNVSLFAKLFQSSLRLKHESCFCTKMLTIVNSSTFFYISIVHLLSSWLE